jgi:transient receptor potential cation channel subfamily C protein 7
MFFAIYALGADDDVLIEPFQNTLTPNIGFILFASFHVTNITVLMSMLIAMLTTSYEAIQEDADVEWKFARTRLYMEFIKDGSTLPIPLNIMPTPNLIFNTINYSIKFFRRDNSRNYNNNQNGQKGTELSYQVCFLL